LEGPRINREGAFTLIEMLLVLVILAGATSLVFPYLSRVYDKARFKAEVRRVAAVFRELRNRAIVEKKVFCIQIDLDERLLRYGPYDRSRLMEEVMSSGYKLPATIRRVSIIGEDEEHDTGKVWFAFYALGSSGGGRVRFYGPKRYAFDMTLKPITGTVILNEEGT
jgi:prepilin-type N-terminal cleavage/methylation domain-containing protein